MHLDVLDLRSFYYRTNLGRAAQKVIRDELTRFWPEAKGQTVAGFGFAVPLLRPFLAEARRVIALMPAQQGVMPWPAGQDNVAVLCEETIWPIETGQIDKLVMMHALEMSEHPSYLLDEAWRVLGPGGKLVLVVPNRAGLWSRRDLTPFGHGRPYSLGQLEAQLKAHNFLTERHRGVLFQPPSHRRIWLKTGAAWESFGRSMPFLHPAGVLMLEASKRVHAPIRPGLPEAVRRPLRVLEGLTQPDPTPAGLRIAGEGGVQDR
jgi:SAM-dependent methyltransferase